MIEIPGNVPSSKNSRVFNYKMKRSFESATVRRYKKKSEYAWLNYRTDFINFTKNMQFPLHVKFGFTRDSKRKFDFINPAQTVQDMMVQYGWIPDDSTEYIIPYFDESVIVDKKSAGVYITLMEKII
jgi:hypothetical protein